MQGAIDDSVLGAAMGAGGSTDSRLRQDRRRRCSAVIGSVWRSWQIRSAPVLKGRTEGGERSNWGAARSHHSCGTCRIRAGLSSLPLG